MRWGLLRIEPGEYMFDNFKYKCQKNWTKLKEFSYLTQINTQLKSQTTDTHLEVQLKQRTSMLEPNIQMLSSRKHTRISIL